MRFVHYSVRAEDPMVPPRAIQMTSSGTPGGVYCYEEGDWHPYASDRPWKFILEPTGAITRTWEYSITELERDLARLRDRGVDVDVLERRWQKFGDRFHGPRPFAQLWYSVSKVRGFDDDEPIGYGAPGFEDGPLARRLLIDLGHAAIWDRGGIIWSSEPRQAVLFTDDSFRVVDRIANMKTNPGRRAPEEALSKYEEFHRFNARDVGEFHPSMKIPARVRELGPAVHVMYASGKVDPETLKKPRGTLNYIHEHDAGVVTYEPDRHGDVKVPDFLREATSLVKLGTCLGIAYREGDDVREMEARPPEPELYCTPCGRALVVVQSKCTILALVWGGALGVEDRGIVG